MTMTELFGDYTFRVVALGAALIGLMSGAVGSFAVLRREALLCDGVSHAALPGIAAAYLITSSRTTEVLLLGAAFAAALAAALISFITRKTHIKFSSALAVVMSVFFGVGILLLSYAQRLPDASQAGLSRFLYGAASSMLARDAYLAALLCAVIFAVLLLFRREFALVSFDPAYAASLGFPAALLGSLLTLLTVAVIILGLQAVGAVLMSALLVAPAVAARQWTRSPGRMALLAALFGGFSGAAGTAVSSLLPSMPTGPVIVVIASAFAAVSLLAAPSRGVVARLISRRRLQKGGDMSVRRA